MAKGRVLGRSIRVQPGDESIESVEHGELYRIVRPKIVNCWTCQ